MKQTQAQTQPQPKPRGDGRGRMLVVALGLSGVGAALAVYALPVFIILYGGMLPTMVAYLTDERPGRHLTLTVTALNLAGLVLALKPFLASSFSLEASFAVVVQPSSWLTVYGFALVGWLLVWIMPLLAASMLEIADRQRFRSLEIAREAIVRKWPSFAARDANRGAEPLGTADEES